MSRTKEKDIKKIAASSGYRLLSQRANKDLKRSRDRDDDDDDIEEKPEVKSIFRKHARRLKRLKKSDLSGEAYDIAEIDAMEKLVLGLLPIAEENYRKFPIHTAASAVNHYITTLSSLQADRRALQDLSARSNRITQVFDQSFDSFTQVMITLVHKLQADIKEKGSTKEGPDLFKEFLRSMGREIVSIKDKNTENVNQLMATPKK